MQYPQFKPSYNKIWANPRKNYICLSIELVPITIAACGGEGGGLQQIPDMSYIAAVWCDDAGFPTLPDVAVCSCALWTCFRTTGTPNICQNLIRNVSLAL